ncbi:hypothetical protein ACRS6Y_09105 [Bacillus cytotoxicus]|uniref:Uncharacterized protein n=3 Tax=Bacillus TaxID=1386 RepID=A0AAX2CGY6_9BACI|nr:hypothetical protein [Bacillus cytotoxicus]QTR77941.1 hypothetical protein JC773_15550 [Bacillus cytotoxicus]SCL92164.1 Protein of unknown function [Bacillus cytotoxicus]
MPWDIGISTMFQQNMGALSIARRLKNQFNLHIIFGGANYQGIMGKKLIEPYSYIDVVCTVEGEEAFLFYVEQYML